MESQLKVETGFQLLARLTQRPSLENLWSHSPVATLPPGSVIEVSGLPGSGKSLIAADAASEVLLPRKYGGCGAGVAIFITDGNLNINWLISNLCKRLAERLSDEEKLHMKTILAESLENLQVTEIFEGAELIVTLEKLELMLTEQANISLVIVDTLTAFYWSEQGTKLQKMDTYMKTLLRKIKKVTKEYKVTTIYVKPTYFATKQENGNIVDTICGELTVADIINCKITMNKIDEIERQQFEMVITTIDASNTCSFTIGDKCLLWNCVL